MWNLNHAQQSQKFRIIGRIPLDDENFASLQGNDLKIQDLCNKVKEGAYNQFYFVNNNTF